MISRRSIYVLAAATCAVLASMTGIPWGDLPNHLARITIIGELLFSPGSSFHQQYTFNWSFVPYFLWDLLAACTSRVLSVSANGVFWTVATFLITFSGGWYLARVRLTRERDQHIAALFSILMATGWCFMWGFFAFQQSLGLCFLTLAVGYRMREPWLSPARRFGLYCGFTALTVACYLNHLAGFLALCLALGAGAVARFWQDRRVWRTEAVGLLPGLAISAWYLYASRTEHSDGPDPYIYGGLVRKALAIASPWLRFPVAWEAPLLIGLGISFLVLFAGAMKSLRKGSARSSLLSDLFFPTILLTLAYLALPQAGFHVWDVDVRMLPFATYFLLLWLLETSRPQERWSSVQAGPILLATGWVSLVILFVQIRPYSREALLIWDGLKHIPAHQVVLPVSTHYNHGRLLPVHHEGVLYAVFGRGTVPYLYDRHNGPMPFFRSLQTYPEVANLWYVREDGPIHPDWPRLKLYYDYLAIYKPFDSRRFPELPRRDLVYENSAIAIFRFKDR